MFSKLQTMERADLHRYLRACPHGEGCEDRCPLKQLRELDPTEAHRLLLRLTHEQAVDKMQAHMLCPRNIEHDKGDVR